MPRIDAFLKLGMSQGCSDVHLSVGVPPMLRMNGDLVPIRFRDLGGPELESYVTEILTRNHLERFRSGEDVDFSYVSEDGGRFRVNVFRKDTGVGAVFRTIPSEVPSIESLALPLEDSELVELPARGISPYANPINAARLGLCYTTALYRLRVKPGTVGKPAIWTEEKIADPDLLGHWTCDDVAGVWLRDASGHRRHGRSLGRISSGLWNLSRSARTASSSCGSPGRRARSST